MKIQYLGTGAAEGIPALFCNCDTCRIARLRGGKEIHSRSQILIDDVLSIDFSPDSFLHSAFYGADLTKIKNIIVTHSHMDHFYAHDFILRGYKYTQESALPKLTIYGNEEVMRVYSECTRREMKEEVQQQISLKEISSFHPFEVDGYMVTPLPAQHSQTESAFVFLIEKDGKSYLHLTDTGRLYAQVYSYLKEHNKKVGVVCFDCTLLNYTKGDVGRHMGIGDNVVVRDLLLKNKIVDENTRYIITHFSHNSKPLQENLKEIEKKYNVIAAYDGMKITV